MSHDKIKAAARRRMAETGEPYSAARRAVLGKYQAAGDQSAPSGQKWFPISFRDAGLGKVDIWLDRYLFGGSPGRAGVEVDADVIRMRGVGDFRLDIPRTSVQSVTRSQFRTRGTTGSHQVSRGRWLVNGTGSGLVELVIGPPLYLGRALSTGFRKPKVNSVIVSLVDPDGFIAAVKCDDGDS
jgi:hypothetical protein